jgi:myo-inositol-1(or 4)-monophosphatase
MDEMFTGEKGKGAFLNGRRLKVSGASRMIDSLLVTGFPYDIASNPDAAVERFVGFLMEAQGVRRLGSAALDLCYVAAGRFEGFWEVYLSPWDMAAGALFVREAGGMTTDMEGAPLSIYQKRVVASNGLMHKAMLDILQKTR